MFLKLICCNVSSLLLLIFSLQIFKYKQLQPEVCLSSRHFRVPQSSTVGKTVEIRVESGDGSLAIFEELELENPETVISPTT